jgi:hypothetical protein
VRSYLSCGGCLVNLLGEAVEGGQVAGHVPAPRLARRPEGLHNRPRRVLEEAAEARRGVAPQLPEAHGRVLGHVGLDCAALAQEVAQPPRLGQARRVEGLPRLRRVEHKLGPGHGGGSVLAHRLLGHIHGDKEERGSGAVEESGAYILGGTGSKRIVYSGVVAKGKGRRLDHPLGRGENGGK